MISVRVPGKVMLAGEYTVLTGRPALAATLDRHLIVRARAESPYGAGADGLMVSSDLWTSDQPVGFMINRRGAFAKPLFDRGMGRVKEWGEAFPLPHPTQDSSELLSPHVPPSHQPLLLAAWEGAQTFSLDRGALHVISELDVRFGLGSSSALYLGVLGACSALATGLNPVVGKAAFQNDPTDWGLPRLAMKLQTHAQKRASGYDIATQFLGGLVECCPFDRHESRGVPEVITGTQASENWPRSAVRLTESSPLILGRLTQYAHLFVGGLGAPTGSLVRSTLNWIQERGILEELCSRDAKVQFALKKLLAEPLSTGSSKLHVKELTQSIKEHRHLLSQMPQYPGQLAQALLETPGCDQTWTFKTTGAGGEDALLLWGDVQHLMEPTRVLRSLGWKRLEAGFERFGMQVQMPPQKSRPRDARPSQL